MIAEPSRAVEQRLRAAIESVPSALILTDAGGVIVLVNREVERLFGYSREELLGKPVEILVPEHLRDPHRATHAEFLEHPRARAMGAGRELYGRRRDGTEVPVEIGLTPVVTDEGVFVVSAIVDISERKRAELRFRAVVESAPCGMVLVDPAGRIVLANRETERLFGYARGELLQMPIEVLVPERVRGDHVHSRNAFFKQPAARAMGAGRELYGRRKDGTEVPVEIGLNPIDTEDGLFVLGSILDISARKAAEAERRHLEEQLRQSQKMEAIGTLAGGIAHDFNNILAVIIGYAELVEWAVSDRTEALDHVTEVLRAGQRGKQMVERILAFSRRQTQQKRPVAIGDTVRETINLLRASLPASVELRTTIAPGAPRVLGDATSIQQVIMNLSTNAAHAISSEGVVELSVEPFYARDAFVRTHPTLREGMYTLLSARDSGVGMDPAVLQRAFEPFFTTKGPGVGTGLGLAMVHNIMRDHQGAIDIESEVGRGTIVRCYFPALVAEVADIAARAATVPRGHGERILYVDDERALAELGEKRLARLGYSVITMTESLRALELLKERSNDFDLLITDYWMPRLTGLDLAAEAHRLRPDLPILMLTGYGDEIGAEALHAAGITRLVCKPLTLQQLGEAVQASLGRGPPAATCPAS